MYRGKKGENGLESKETSEKLSPMKASQAQGRDPKRKVQHAWPPGGLISGHF